MPKYLRVATTALLLLLAACGSTVPAGSDQPDIAVGFVVDPSWAQIPVAQQAGYFEQRGVRVKVINFSTGVEALQALQGGQVDVTTAADVPSASALAKSEDLRVVGDGSRWTGSALIARRAAAATTIAQLAGKRIGTPMGTSAAYFATDALAHAGVRAEIVQVAPSAMVSAMSKGDVDAVSIFQPYQEQVLDTLGGDAVKLVTEGEVYRQHSLYLSRADTITSKREALTRFFAALDQAGADLGKGDDKAVSSVASATNLPATLVRGMLSEFDFHLQLQPDLAAELGQLADWARSMNYLDPATPRVDYGRLLDSAALPRT